MRSAACTRFVVAFASVITGVCASPTLAFSEGADGTVEIRSGTATFDVATSIPVVSVHGKTAGLEGRARIRHEADVLVIEQLEAVLPIRTLSTGIALRDEHMRKYVFTTADGAIPDVRFVVERASCTGWRTRTCDVSGDLLVRGTARPFTLTLSVKGDAEAFRATGEGILKLSSYGIAAPSQLGVKTMDDVRLHLDFSVKRVDERIALGTSR